MERGSGRKQSAPALVFAPEPRPRAEVPERRGAPSLAEARASLEAALQENLALARREGADHWGEWFTDALERLHLPPGPDDPWTRVTAGCAVPAEVLALARAAQKSHVFGGMGSWNDVGFDNDAEKERLYVAMSDAWGAVFAALRAHATAG